MAGDDGTKLSGNAVAPNGPANDAVAITASDVTTYNPCSAFVLAVGGVLKVDTANGSTVTLTLPAGVIPLRVTRFYNTSLTASGITALYHNTV